MTDDRRDLYRGRGLLQLQPIPSTFEEDRRRRMEESARALQIFVDEINRITREWSDAWQKAMATLHTQVHDTQKRAGNRRRSMKYQPPPRTLTHNINPTGHPPHRVARSHFSRRHRD